MNYNLLLKPINISTLALNVKEAESLAGRRERGHADRLTSVPGADEETLAAMADIREQK